MAPPSASSAAAATSVQVAVRIRPNVPQDASSIPARFQRTVVHPSSDTALSVEPSTSSHAATGSGSGSSLATTATMTKRQAFAFDRVLPPDTNQYTLFQTTAEPLVARFLEGYNCTILAYGQTSSGKTHSMTGVDLDADPADPNNGMGIVPRAVNTIFQRTQDLKRERGSSWTCTIKGSFIEIYNEDLIDLLSMDDGAGGRREVQIREDKSGAIIWGGLREVGVRNVNEVMSLIKQGASIRRTNETDMNAQSSRSHAIFSLTLTQRKFKGTSAPPVRAPSPLPPGHRSPSRLARPSSTFSPVSNRTGTMSPTSPTFGRPPTPSFAAAMAGNRSSLRPSSALGHNHERNSEDGEGEWVTVVSKFHFVDLAGSERLKRTAAQGDRIKEGISINSGLLALGNVISALGDPSRAKTGTASHIPYRDSKLTRLLQDSIGGNAYTLMLACISAAEWNVGETVNTLKYANRARNIKNRAVVNEKEEGWDDLEWLQTTVTRLRKELKVIKDGGAPALVTSSTTHHDLAEVDGAGKKVLAQLVELQTSYDELRTKFSHRTEELTRLRQEVGESHRSNGGAAGAMNAMSKYEEIVGPVIEEYEKTIGAMEAELSLNRAALRHTNELVEEKEDELAQLSDRHMVVESYVEELRSRIAKLSEREAFTEAYVRDLEEKLKTYDESATSSSESVTDLRKELAKWKDTDKKSSQYINELEQRLAHSDESVVTLRQSVEKLESLAESRRAEAVSLKSRLDAIQSDGQGWRADLDERERHVKELEEKMQEWEAKRLAAGEERVRISNVVNNVEKARHSLEIDLKTASAVNGKTTVDSFKDLETQFSALQQTHSATLADLESVSGKYRDALREISDLASQLEEAKLQEHSNSVSEGSPEPHHTFETRPIPRRRMTESRSEGSPTSARRLFFRHAASTESLRSRSLSQSQSLSQELSSARSPRSILKPRSDSLLSNGNAGLIPPVPTHRPTASLGAPFNIPGQGERSVSSLENEIMRLQDVLKEREAEIATLEKAMKDHSTGSNNSAPAPSNVINTEITVNGVPHSGLQTPKTPERALSPHTLENFHALKDSVRSSHSVVESDDASSTDGEDSLRRLNELMLAMAQKESQHRAQVDDLNEQRTIVEGRLAALQKQHDELNVLTRDQTHNMSTELEALRGQHADVTTKLETMLLREQELMSKLKQVTEDHEGAMEKLRTEQQQALDAKDRELASLSAQLDEKFGALLAELQAQLATAQSEHLKSRQDHDEAIQKLQAEHDEAIGAHKSELQRLTSEHEGGQQKAVAEADNMHAEVARLKEEEASATLQRTEAQYYAALQKLRNDHMTALEALKTESNEAQERLKEQYASELKMANITREGLLSDSEAAQANTLQKLQSEHESALSRETANHRREMGRLKAAHDEELARRVAESERSHKSLVDRHAKAFEDLEARKDAEIEQHVSALSQSREEHVAAMQKSRGEHETLSRDLEEQHASSIEKLQKEHQAAVDRLQADHQVALTQLEANRGGILSNLKAEHNELLSSKAAEHEAALSALKSSHEEVVTLRGAHAEEVARLQREYQTAVSEHQQTITAAEDHHRSMLESARIGADRTLSALRDTHQGEIAKLVQDHSRERDVLVKDNQLLRDQVKTMHSEIAESTASHEHVRSGHEKTLSERDVKIIGLQGNLTAAHTERETLLSELSKLRRELQVSASKQKALVEEAVQHKALVEELDRSRSTITELQADSQRRQDLADAAQVEKQRQDTLIKELQDKISSSPPPVNGVPLPPVPETRTLGERTHSFTRANGMLSSSKLPPISPPPSVPPPPPPTTKSHLPPVPSDTGHSITSTFVRSSSSSRDSQPESPSTSVGPSLTHGATNSSMDLKAALDAQKNLAGEQEIMIKTLEKKLHHSEGELKAHASLVSTLENSLGDSERNLRKARMQATELAKERDKSNQKLETLRTELQDAKRELTTIRRSVLEEKQSLEHRLDEERKAKERARAALDARVDEVQRRKSKFACL